VNAPDDLARTQRVIADALVEHGMAAPRGKVRYGDARALCLTIARALAEAGHLASVVSRRTDIRTPDVLTDSGRPTVLDADLRTRIETLMREVGRREDAGDGFLTHVYDELYAIANALDPDTRDTRDEDIRLAVKRLRELVPSFRDPSHYASHEDISLVHRLEASLVAHSRVPADTDTQD
jgi:hypothetical protein